jgi:CHAD domain-containing protein
MLDELLEEVKRLREQVGNLSDKVVLLERAEATWYSMVADELDGDYND